MPNYQPNIPQAPDVLADSQDDLLNNFQQLNTAWDINHVPFNIPTQGQHTQVTLPNNNTPTATPIATANIWSAQSGLTNTTELFWQRENGGRVIPWTGASLPTTIGSGWTRLPSGMLLKWGQALAVANASVVVFPAAGTIPPFLPIGGPVAFSPLMVQVTLLNNNTIIPSVFYGNNNLGFTISLTDSMTGGAFVGTADICWLAIGV